MRRNIKVRGRNGIIRDEIEGYPLADGEAMIVPIAFLDSRRMITDTHGQPAGCRPGFLYNDSDVAEAVKETLDREYRDDIEQRWQSDRWSKPSPRGGGSPVTGATGSSVDDVYAEYRREISERWK